MRRCGAFGGMIAANIGIVDEAGHRGDQSRDDSEEHRIKRIADQIRHRWKRETRQIEQEAQEKQSDRKVDKHRVKRMPQRFTFKKILQHGLPLFRWKIRTASFGDLSPFCCPRSW